MFATHGLPEELVSDNGAQFVPQEFKDFLRGNKIKHVLSASYYPGSNSKVERAVRTFKDDSCQGDPGTQNQKITSFLLSYCTTPHTATRCTPAELLMNHRLHTRLDLLHQGLWRKVARPSRM